jgi:hypothetical protein
MMTSRKTILIPISIVLSPLSRRHEVEELLGTERHAVPYPNDIPLFIPIRERIRWGREGRSNEIIIKPIWVPRARINDKAIFVDKQAMARLYELGKLIDNCLTPRVYIFDLA